MDRRSLDFEKKYVEKIEDVEKRWQQVLLETQRYVRHQHYQVSSYSSAMTVASDVSKVIADIETKMREHGIELEVILENANTEALAMMEETIKNEIISIMHEICEKIFEEMSGLKTSFNLAKDLDFGESRFVPNTSSEKIKIYWRDAAKDAEVREIDKERKELKKKAEETQKNEIKKKQEQALSKYEKAVEEYKEKCAERQRKIDSEFAEYCEEKNEEKKKNETNLEEKYNKDVTEIKERISNTEKQINEATEERGTLGVFAFSRKKDLKNKIINLSQEKTDLEGKLQEIGVLYENNKKEIAQRIDADKNSFKDSLKSKYNMPSEPKKKDYRTEEEWQKLFDEVTEMLRHGGRKRFSDLQRESSMLGALDSDDMSNVLRKMMTERKIHKVVDKKIAYFEL